MRKQFLLAYACSGIIAAVLATAPAAAANLKKIGHIVVIIGENHSFDQLYGDFPGADGVTHLPPAAYLQRDRDGSLLKTLPPIWIGLLDPHMRSAAVPHPPQIPEAATRDLPNAPFAINGERFAMPYGVATRDLWHLFYENQMQIDHGKNDKFAAYSNAGALTMGYYARKMGEQRPLDELAHRFVLADHFFQGAFGGSYINHQYLICACTNVLTPQQQTRNAVMPGHSGQIVVPVTKLEADGITLTPAANMPRSALDGAPRFAASTEISPLDPVRNVYDIVNTMQPPYPPSATATGPTGRHGEVPQIAVDLDSTITVPPQHAETIGDQLSRAGIAWAWYAGAMQYAIEHGVYNGAAGPDAHGNITPNFQPHHNPFNYYAAYAPGTEARKQHLRDGGMNGDRFLADIDANKLPAVVFYKPQGNLNGHPGYSDALDGDLHIRDVIENHLMKSPAWKDMVVIVTYDEFGGQFDHLPPPMGDKYGPGTRVPALIISPLAKKGFVDHTNYDTASILRLIEHRFALPALPGIAARDAALVKNGQKEMGDLTASLHF
jgi:phospholipase C